jgi:transporter family-2 protein
MFSLAAICGLNVGSLLVDKWGVSRGTGVPLTPRRITAVVISLIAGLLAVVPYLGLQSAPTIYFLLVVAAGIGAAIQFAMTARVGEASGDSTVAAWVLFAVATVFLLGLAISQGSFANNGTSSLLSAVAASPWLLIGGLLGSAVVIVNAYVVQRTGVLVFSLSLIAGQLIAALIIDQISGVLTNASFVVGACALMIFATAISAGGRGTAARPTEESPSLSSSDTPLT